MENSSNYLNSLNYLDGKNNEYYFFHLNNKQKYEKNYFQYLEEDNFQFHLKQEEKYNELENSFFSLDNAENWYYLDYLDYLQYIEHVDYLNVLEELDNQQFLQITLPKQKRRWDHILRYPKPIVIYNPLTIFKNILLILFIGSLTIIIVIILPNLKIYIKEFNYKHFIQDKRIFQRINEIFKKIKNNIIPK